MGADIEHTKGAPFIPAASNAFMTQEINNSSTKKIVKNKSIFLKNKRKRCLNLRINFRTWDA